MTATADELRTTDVHEAEAEYRAALEAWNGHKAGEADARKAIERDASGVTVHRLNETEREVHLAELRDERPRVARRVEAARAALVAANVDRASEVLPDALAEHESAADRMLARRCDLEAAIVGVLRATWALGEAARDERTTAAAVLGIAAGAAPDDEVRDQLRRERYELPVALGKEGPTDYRERPTLGLWDGPLDPSDVSFWTTLGQLARTDRRRAFASMGRHLREAVESAERSD